MNSKYVPTEVKDLIAEDLKTTTVFADGSTSTISVMQHFQNVLERMKTSLKEKKPEETA